MRPGSTGDRTLALFFLGLAAFTPPILAIFSVAESWFGIPVLYLYVFCAWAGLVLLMGLSTARGGRRAIRRPAPAQTEPSTPPEER
ncbi:MAG: hypothetical protein BroJett029_27640 [Alphaproteobacteria bacterium]|nr:MAG: hypothetical protein BroJett029_27640 [Alphaproteobacteria bacterium]